MFLFLFYNLIFYELNFFYLKWQFTLENGIMCITSKKMFSSLFMTQKLFPVTNKFTLPAGLNHFLSYQIKVYFRSYKLYNIAITSDCDLKSRIFILKLCFWGSCVFMCGASWVKKQNLTCTTHCQIGISFMYPTLVGGGYTVPCMCTFHLKVSVSQALLVLPPKAN